MLDVLSLAIVTLTLAMLISVKGETITALQGENKVIQVNLDPVPPNSTVLIIIHPSGKLLFIALGRRVSTAGTDAGKRVTDTSNTDTETGNIEFTLENVTLEDAGDFAIGYNTRQFHLHIDAVVTLVVYVKPSTPNITTSSSPVVGHDICLECNAQFFVKQYSPNKSQMNFEWYRDGSDLPVEDRYATTGSQLHVKNIQKSDSDTVFTCKTYETASIPSDVSDGYTMIVQYGPDRVYPYTAQQHSLVENTGILDPVVCSADCVPTCTYKWIFEGADFGSSGDTLTINNIQRASAGTYWCIASNDHGTDISKNVTVNVNYSASLRSDYKIPSWEFFITIGLIGLLSAIVTGIGVRVCTHPKRASTANNLTYESQLIEMETVAARTIQRQEHEDVYSSAVPEPNIYDAVSSSTGFVEGALNNEPTTHCCQIHQTANYINPMNGNERISDENPYAEPNVPSGHLHESQDANYLHPTSDNDKMNASCSQHDSSYIPMDNPGSQAMTTVYSVRTSGSQDQDSYVKMDDPTRPYQELDLNESKETHIYDEMKGSVSAQKAQYIQPIEQRRSQAINTVVSVCTSSYQDQDSYIQMESPTNPNLNGDHEDCSGSNKTNT